MERELLDIIEKEHIILAIKRIDVEGYPSNRKSSTYDLVFEGITYPPKYVLSLAGYFANRKFISHDEFKGGDDSAAFKVLRDYGFSVLPKDETKDLKHCKASNSKIHFKYTYHFTPNPIDGERLEGSFQNYYDHCLNTEWLSKSEAYKFRFGRWINDRIDFDSQTNEEILSICKESQEISYEEKSKGVNFILANLRYSDNFIELQDIQLLRKISDPEFLLEAEDLSGRSMSFPKFSIWAGVFYPSQYMVYANEELIKGLAHLYRLIDYPKSGIRSFNLARACLKDLKGHLQKKYKDELEELIGLIFKNEPIREVDLVWLVQDFILFISRHQLMKAPNYYWVNQGTKYNQEFKHSCICAPNDETHHHKRLKDLKEGDILIHYANTMIRATSKVLGEARVGKRPYEDSGENQLIVDVDYSEIENPIRLDMIKSKLAKNRGKLPEKYSPFTKDLSINQAYLLELNNEVFDLIMKEDLDVMEEQEVNYQTKTGTPINTILYGPPGTGKTYSTIDRAVAIVNPKKYKVNDHLANQQVFNALREQGKIVFTTFHQSYSYEDFIEGIKPKLIVEESDPSEIGYSIEDGIFKELCISASEKKSFRESGTQKPFISNVTLEKQRIFKISLGDSQNSADDEILDYCLKNECIGTGWGEDVDFTGVKSRKEIRERFAENGLVLDNPQDFNISAIERIVLQMDINDLVFISFGTRKLKAIAQITGDYYYDSSSPIRFNQYRKVKWLYTDLDIPVKEFYSKFFSQQSIYEIDKSQINKEFFMRESVTEVENEDEYVIIIDEINRGNIAQIFGELITLIEVSKRKDMPDELEVILPYSKKPFSVPKNIHIIGTMNTADRSIEALDSALRRRFVFEELMPNYEVFDKVLGSSKVWHGIDLSSVLKNINERIEVLIDRDHQIGHAYFLSLKGLSGEQYNLVLKSIFVDQIIPLLQEYFYNDYVKIGMVLGSGFIETVKTSQIKFAKIEGSVESDYNDYQIYRIKEDIHSGNFDLRAALDMLMTPN